MSQEQEPSQSATHEKESQVPGYRALMSILFFSVIVFLLLNTLQLRVFGVLEHVPLGNSSEAIQTRSLIGASLFALGLWLWVRKK